MVRLIFVVQGPAGLSDCFVLHARASEVNISELKIWGQHQNRNAQTVTSCLHFVTCIVSNNINKVRILDISQYNLSAICCPLNESHLPYKFLPRLNSHVASREAHT
jgi:hypothetical protein